MVLRLAIHRAGLAVTRLRAFIQTRRICGFHHNADGLLCPEQLVIETDGRRRQRTHASLHKNMRWLADALRGQLLLRLGKHRGVALHHPCWHVLITIPRCITDHLPAVCLSIAAAFAHGIIVVASRPPAHRRRWPQSRRCAPATCLCEHRSCTDSRAAWPPMPGLCRGCHPSQRPARCGSVVAHRRRM